MRVRLSVLRWAALMFPTALASIPSAALEGPERGRAATGSASRGLEEITVTAQKREENLQSVPLSISALSSEDLEQRGITSYEGIAAATPSVAFTPFAVSSNVLVLYMRGQGNANPNMITTDGAVGLYENGFYIARPNASTFDLGDIERVEVLRGPQGTLWGRNTTGGAINLISRAPTGVFGLKQDFTFGSRNEFRSVTTVNLPKWADVSAKVTLLRSGIDGYVRNTGSSHDYGEQEQQAGRLALHWDPLDIVAVDYFFEKGTLDSTPVYFQNDSLAGLNIAGVVYPDAKERETRTYRALDLKQSTSDFEMHGLTVAWDVSDALTIKSLTGYRKLNWDAYQNFADALTAAPRVPLRITSEDLVHADQFSQEIQFLGSLSDLNLNYVAGLYYFKETGSHAAPQYITSPFGTNLSYRRVTADSDSKAVFGQLTWTPPILDNRLDVTVGARYTRDNRSAERSASLNGVFSERGKATGSDNDKDYSRFNPAMTLNYRWTSLVSSYFRVATGYRAGGSYEASPPGRFNQTFAPEKLTTYELGLKSQWLDQRLQINGAIFDSKYDDMQLVVKTNPMMPAEQQVYNAGKATIKGLELDVLVAPTDDWTASLNYAYLDADLDKVKVIAGTIYDNNANPYSPYQVGDDIKHLLTMPLAPKNAFTVATDYTFWHFDEGSLAGHLDYRFQSLVYETASSGPGMMNRDFDAQRAYGLLNGRLTLDWNLPRDDKARISIWGRNLTNRKYKQLVAGQGTPGVPVAPGQIPGYTSQAAAWVEPPTYGIDLSYIY